MKKLLLLATVGEAVTGAALLVAPSLVGRVLLGTELIGISIPVARVAGIALIALGLACWPSGRKDTSASAVRGMLLYSVTVTLYLACLGIGGEWVGSLLWPAVVVHMVLTILLVRGWVRERKIEPIKGDP